MSQQVLWSVSTSVGGVEAGLDLEGGLEDDFRGHRRKAVTRTRPRPRNMRPR